MQMEYITTPLVGGLIGIVTNGLAIKMIFRPVKPVYIGRFRLPFTPGLVPKEQKRIAAAIGRVAGEKILDTDTLKKALVSENVKSKMLDKFDETMQKFSDIEDTVEVFLEKKGIIDTINDSEEKIKSTVSEHIRQSLIKADIGKVIVEYAEDEIIEKLNPMIYSIAAGAIASAKEPMAKKVNSIIDNKAPAIICEYIDKEYSTILKTPVKEFEDKLSEKFPDLRENLWKWYEKFVDEKAESIIRGFNIQKVVEDKICEFDVEELEKIIMKITKKELNALVYLGGVLGILMGFINILIL